MRALFDTLTHRYTCDEISEGTKWILLFAGACYSQAGLVKLAQSSFIGWVLLAVGGAFLAAGTIRFYLIRFLAIAAWTAFLGLHFYATHNPVAVFFAAVGVYHSYKMLRYRTARVENIK